MSAYQQLPERERLALRIQCRLRCWHAYRTGHASRFDIGSDAWCAITDENMRADELLRGGCSNSADELDEYWCPRRTLDVAFRVVQACDPTYRELSAAAAWRRLRHEAARSWRARAEGWTVPPGRPTLAELVWTLADLIGHGCAEGGAA